MHRDKVLVDVAREQAFVRITDKHDLLGGLEGVVHLKEASFQSVRLVHGVDGGAGQIEDYLACLGTVQDGDHPLPKAAAVLGHEAEDEVMFLVHQEPLQWLRRNRNSQ